MAELRPPYTIYVTEKVHGDHFWATYVFGFCHYGSQRMHPGRRNETRLASWVRATCRSVKFDYRVNAAVRF